MLLPLLLLHLLQVRISVMINICYKLLLLEPSDGNSTTKPSGASSNNDPKSSTDKSNKATDGDDAAKKPSSGVASTDHIHISFEGLETDHSLKISFSSYFISF